MATTTERVSRRKRDCSMAKQRLDKNDPADISSTPTLVEQVPDKGRSHPHRAAARTRATITSDNVQPMPPEQTPVRAKRNEMRSASTGELRKDRQATKRGLPADYAGDDPYSCNAPTKTGMPCRAIALESGHCKKHGGTGKVPKRPFKKRVTREALIEMVEEFIAKRPGLKERIQADRKT